MPLGTIGFATEIRQLMRTIILLFSSIRIVDFATVCLAGSLTLYLLAWRRSHARTSRGSFIFLFGALSPVATILIVKIFNLYLIVQIVSSIVAMAIPVVVGIAMINLLIRGELT